MYEKFTDRASKVMNLANQEAQRFNHEYIGTEHVLLGLVKEGSGVAANVLKNLDVSLRKIRIEVEKMVQSGVGEYDLLANRKLPHTPRVVRVIEYSVDESRKLNHTYVGTEHLLLGLLREEEGTAARVLVALGVGLVAVRAETILLLGPKSTEPTVSMTHVRLDGKVATTQKYESSDIGDAPEDKPKLLGEKYVDLILQLVKLIQDGKADLLTYDLHQQQIYENGKNPRPLTTVRFTMLANPDEPEADLPHEVKAT